MLQFLCIRNSEMYMVAVKLLAEASVISTQLRIKGFSTLTWLLIGLFLTTGTFLHRLPKCSHMAGGDLRGRIRESPRQKRQSF